jgi:HTH-type transcriptional regulator, cell division transcriptional repressor
MQADTPGAWYDETTSTLGDRLTAAREAQGLSEADLATRLGIRKRTVTQWETDMSEPRANRLHLLSGVLGVSLMWLINGQGDGVAGPDDVVAPRGDGLASELHDIALGLAALSEQLRRVEMRLRAGPQRLAT